MFTADYFQSDTLTESKALFIGHKPNSCCIREEQILKKEHQVICDKSNKHCIGYVHKRVIQDPPPSPNGIYGHTIKN